MPEQIQVLIVDLSKKYGGASVRALMLADHLKPWKVAIAGLEDGPVVGIARQRNIPVRIVGKKRTDPLIAWRLSKVIREEGFQVIDTQNIPSKFWGSLATLLTNVAFVSTLNSSYEDEFGTAMRGKIYTRLDRWTNATVDRYIAVSKAIYSGLIKAGVPEPQIDLITNGVDVGSVLPQEEQIDLRKRLGIPENAILCVSVGRLVWAKGYEDLIEAFKLIKDQVPPVYAVIVGGGVLYASLTETIREAGLQDRMTLLGQCDVETTSKVMKACDIFVLSSRSEGVPYALLEAAAAELPIVSTCVGGIPEVLVSEKEALLVPAASPSAISTAIIRLIQNRQLAQTLAAGAKAKIEREYSLSAQVAEVRHAYQKAFQHKWEPAR